jgi:hypothetical protein
MIADGGEAIADLAVLRNQPGLFGLVASPATCWRVLDAVDADPVKNTMPTHPLQQGPIPRW